MASVDRIERAEAPEEGATQTWGDVEQQGTTSRRGSVCVLTGITAICCALAIFLIVGSEPLTGSKDGDETQEAAVAAASAIDTNALGCFKDSATNRTLVLELTDAVNMTPDVRRSLIFHTKTGGTLFELFSEARSSVLLFFSYPLHGDALCLSRQDGHFRPKASLRLLLGRGVFSSFLRVVRFTKITSVSTAACSGTHESASCNDLKRHGPINRNHHHPHTGTRTLMCKPERAHQAI